MSIFQIIFLVVCGVQAAVALVRFLRSRQVIPLMFLGIWSTAIVLISYPALSTRIANAVGIGRGVDLVTYGLLFTFVWAHYQQYQRYKRVEGHLTELVRDMAIHKASRPGSCGSTPDDSSVPAGSAR